MDSTSVGGKVSVVPVGRLRRVASMRLISNILDQSQGIVDSGVDITRGYRISDAEKLKTALPVAYKLLFCPVDQGIVVDGAEVAGERLELVIHIVQRNPAVIDDEHIDEPLEVKIAIVTTQLYADFFAFMGCFEHATTK